jgi:putative membrane protein
MPALIGAVVLLFTYKKFKLTPLLYILILIHSAILMLGAHFTYAEVPLPNLFGSLFGEGRNNFDKIGHLAQGFVPAIIAREILIRKNMVNIKKWLSFLVISICLSFSALYELIEWLVALLTGEDADAFLGTQGYVWDTQTDMFMALAGSVVAVLTLSKLHDKQLKNI